jgi:hypothetical protein
MKLEAKVAKGHRRLPFLEIKIGLPFSARMISWLATKMGVSEFTNINYS